MSRTELTAAQLALQDKAHNALKLEMTAALLRDPAARTVTNPWCGAKLSALSVVRREFTENHCDAAELSMLAIIGALALEQSELGLRASDWIDARAEHVANMFCVELAAQWAKDAEPAPARIHLDFPRAGMSAEQVAAMDETAGIL